MSDRPELPPISATTQNLLAFVIGGLSAKFKPPLRLRAAMHAGAYLELAELAGQFLGLDLLRKAESEIESSIREGDSVFSVLDSHYPDELRTIQSPPLVVFVRGVYSPRFNVAVVGARECSPLAREISASFAESLTLEGASIISGLAYGVDISAHSGALRAAKRSSLPAGTAVLGGGFSQFYPAAHYEIAHEMVAHGGCIISEFPPSAPPLPPNFLRRNRLISGLSDLVLVVEAAERSGSLSTARLAAEQGREVGAMPGPLANERCAGSNDLLRQGAHIILSPDDALRLAPLSKRPFLLAGLDESRSRIDEPELTSPTLKSVYAKLSRSSPISFDRLVINCQMGTTELASALMELELLGALEQPAPGLYLRA